MTWEQFETALEKRRELYINQTEQEGITAEEWDEYTRLYWEDETELWEAYKGHPYTKPRPRPH